MRSVSGEDPPDDNDTSGLGWYEKNGEIPMGIYKTGLIPSEPPHNPIFLSFALSAFQGKFLKKTISGKHEIGDEEYGKN